MKLESEDGDTTVEEDGEQRKRMVNRGRGERAEGERGVVEGMGE